MSDDPLPEWAEEWLPGRCDCGARLVLVACWGHGHVVCAGSGYGVEGGCPNVKDAAP